MTAHTGAETQDVDARTELRALRTTPPTHQTVSCALSVLERAVYCEHSRGKHLLDLIEGVAVRNGWEDLQMRVRLLRAELCRHDGDIVTAAVMAREIRSWAIAHGDELLIARCHNTLSTVFRYIGDHGESLVQAVKTVVHTPPDAPIWIRVNHQVMLAIALSLTNSMPAARQRYQKALEMAEEAGDRPVELMVLNNLAFAMYSTGAHEQAEAFAVRMRSLQRRGVTMFAQYLDTLARIELQAGNHEEVERLLAPVIREPNGPLVNHADALPVCLLTLTESRRNRGDLDGAQQSLDWCLSVATERGLRHTASQAIREQAALLAARGDFRAAYEELTRFQVVAAELQNAEREMRADIAHAIYEVQEARLAQDEFRELARRDPLTGLHNRRVVDEQLPELIKRSEQTGQPFSVALIDLDHFKRINDTFSHETGDAVLRQVAALILDGAPPAASVARLGGEEFLVILPGCDAQASLVHAEAIRAGIAAYRWGDNYPVAGVTASIGVATCRGRTTPPILLSRADRSMYAAKRAGRNRVVGEPDDAHSDTSVTMGRP